MDSALILLRKSTWIVLSSDGQICNGISNDLFRKWIWRDLGSEKSSCGQICISFSIHSIKKIRLESSWALTDKCAMDSALILIKKSTWKAPELWRTDLQWNQQWFYSENESGETWALRRAPAGRFATASLFILLRKSGEPMGSDRQMCNGFCIDSIKKINLESSWALTDRFAIESAMISFRKWIWRDLGSEKSSCGRFATASLFISRKSAWRAHGLRPTNVEWILHCFY